MSCRDGRRLILDRLPQCAREKQRTLRRADVNKILTSTGAVVTVFCLTARAPANSQEFFASAYARPAEMVDGLHVGTRVDGADIFAPARVVAAQNCHAGTVCGRRLIAH
jgi:hypothetical protein